MINCTSKNPTINKFCEDGKINQSELNILFEDKKDWYTEFDGTKDWSSSNDKITEFTSTLSKVLSLMNNQKTDLRYIRFPQFDFYQYNPYYPYIDTIFAMCIFEGETNFSQMTLNGKTMFSDATFKSNVKFNESTFKGEVDFERATFNGKVSFLSTSFEHKISFIETQFCEYTNFHLAEFAKEAYFESAIFSNDVSFKGATFNKKFSLYNAKITKLNLLGTLFDDTNLLNISAYNGDAENGKALTKENFANKEMARLIKGHLDSHNNITESNKYFALEQDLYLYEILKSTSTEPNKWQTIITLFLNKYVSHFGTDWLRSLAVLIIFGYIVMIGYMGLDTFGYLENDKEKNIKHFAINIYWSYSLLMIIGWGFIYNYTFTKNKFMAIAGLVLIGWILFIANIYNLEPRAFTNYIVQITNPIGAFKDVELYKGIEFYATIVRITIAVMIYQLIVAFRNNTRRS